MNLLRKSSLYTASAAVLVLAVVAMPVYAHEGSDDGTSSSTQSGSSNSGSGSRQKNATLSDAKTTETENEVEDHAQEDKAKAKGAELLSEAKKAHKAKTKEERKNVCEQRKKGFETRATVLVKNAEKHQTRIDSVLSKAVDYKTTNNLTVADYDALLAAADSAQTTSQASVTALKNLQPTLDCTSETVASNIASFKAATDQARQDLNAYKKSVQALLSAVENAKQGGDQ